ncbi:glycosyl hydrolase family 28-related protein [Paraurantiacibacter namhicola]|uniref:Pectate lyase superfamily protein n=1 Tax=Paraurantiacibacter namhicola TaxID=645517 RepID=A0A1C7D787_9SPHN|nr:glycosyl hydrolase family 28-related protein [Paraurantiacibacter namhicola]ANU07330.1 Pectate lyase superfamily protein [Paraurantiacibacter namhicola]
MATFGMGKVMKFGVLGGAVSAAALGMAAAAGAAAGPGIPKLLTDPKTIADNYLPDFSYAGYGYGVKPIPRVDAMIDVADYGAIPDDGLDDSVALKAALAAAHEAEGPVRVQMHSGRYQLTEILWIEKSGIVLAGMGSGAGGTQLYMPRPLNQIDGGGAFDEIKEYLVRYDKRERQKGQNLDVLFSPYSWTGGFIWTRFPGGRHATYLEELDRPIENLGNIARGKRGTMELTLGGTGNVSVGDVVQINWHNRAGENGPLIQAIYGDFDGTIGSRHWEFPERPLVRQATKITAVKGNRITIADPLLHDISSAVPANFARWDHISEVGLQDFSLIFPDNPYFGHHNEAGYNGVYFTGVYNGWISNVHIKDADSAVLTDDLANVTIRNILTYGDHKAHYAVHVGNVHNVLVDNMTVRNPTQHTFSFNTQSTKSVYKDSEGWHEPTLDQHAGANHQNLYDNITVHVRPDGTAEDGSPQVYLFRAGGAGYWKPGHGGFNTIWNLKVLAEGDVAPGQELVVLEDSGGPMARVVGLHGNRPLRLDYRPDPYTEMLGMKVTSVPSLYEWQRARR